MHHECDMWRVRGPVEEQWSMGTLVVSRYDGRVNAHTNELPYDVVSVYYWLTGFSRIMSRKHSFTRASRVRACVV